MSSPSLTTLEGLAELRAAHAARIPGWQAPVAWALAVDGELPRINLPGGAHGLASVSLALACGHDGSTATVPVQPAQLAEAVALLEPAEACREVEHPNLAVWRAALSAEHELAAVFVADLSDPVSSDLDARLRSAL
jgi:hypothetical protein